MNVWCSFQSIIFITWKSILDKLLELPANYLNGLFYFLKITDFRIVPSASLLALVHDLKQED